MSNKKKHKRRDAATKGWKTRRKNVKTKDRKNDGSNRKLARKSLGKKKEKPYPEKTSRTINTRKQKRHSSPTQKRKIQNSRVTKNEKPKKPAQQKRVAKSTKKSTGKRKQNFKSVSKRNRSKKAKKSSKTVRRLTDKSKRSKVKKPAKPEPSKSNRTYFVTVKLASGKRERKKPLNVIVWAKDGFKNQEVIDLLWAMIKRRRDKNLMYALDMEIRELIVAQGPLTDRMQGYRMN